MQQHTWTVRVGSSGPGVATATARKHRFQVGEPLTFDDEYGQLTALEYLLGALGSEIVNELRKLARQRRMDLEPVEATVQAELNNPLTYLGVIGETGHPGLQRILVRVYISTLDTEDRIAKLWEEALRRLPLVRTMQAAAAVELSWKIVV